MLMMTPTMTMMMKSWMTQYSEPGRVGSAKDDGSDSFPLHKQPTSLRLDLLIYMLMMIITTKDHGNDDDNDGDDDDDTLVPLLLHQVVCLVGASARLFLPPMYRPPDKRYKCRCKKKYKQNTGDTNTDKQTNTENDGVGHPPPSSIKIPKVGKYKNRRT